MRLAAVLSCAVLAAIVGGAPSSAPANPAGGSTSPAVRRALEGIRGEALRAHMRFLADDRLEGRGTGTPGYDLAAAYMATQFEAAGLAPGGPDGAWFQTVPFRRMQGDPAAGVLALVRDGRERRLEPDHDYLPGSDPLHERAELTAPLAFAGFGITAPSLGYDDYAHVDVRGKVVVLLSGGPPTFPSTQRAYFSSNLVKVRNAVERGAVGVLTVRTPVDEARGPWARAVLQSRLPGMRWVDGEGVPNESFPQLELTALMSRRGAEALFEGAREPLERVFAAAEAGRPQGFDLPGQVRAATRTRHERVESPNVIGLLRGSDPALREEYVVVTAHLDHLGIGVATDGDSIHNGAYDNATGCGALIEIARALATLPERPRRSILFVALTGEEKGLQGSDHFARFPPVPAARIVANVNMDMFLMLEPMRDVIVFGGEHTSLGPVAERVARAVGLRPIPDPVPEEVIFIRSDQFSFVRRGIPAVYTALAGADRVAPGDSLSPVQRWRRTVYHSPRDDMDQPMHLESGATYMRMQLLIALEVANAPRRPTWNRGDFFGGRFAAPAR